MHTLTHTHTSIFRRSLAQELLTVLEVRPFSFAVELAALAARREFLNLEMWANNKVDEYRDPFVNACLDFLADKMFSYSDAEAKPNFALYMDTAATIFKIVLSKRKCVMPAGCVLRWFVF